VRNQPARTRWHLNQITGEIEPNEQERHALGARRKSKRRTRELRCANPSAPKSNRRRMKPILHWRKGKADGGLLSISPLSKKPANKGGPRSKRGNRPAITGMSALGGGLKWSTQRVMSDARDGVDGRWVEDMFEGSTRRPRRSCGTAGGTHSRLNRVARQLNERSREALGFETHRRTSFNACVASTD
jgi:hypothetical protein